MIDRTFVGPPRMYPDISWNIFWRCISNQVIILLMHKTQYIYHTVIFPYQNHQTGSPQFCPSILQTNFFTAKSLEKKQVVPRLKESASSFKVNPVSLTDSQNNTTVMCCWKCFKLFSVLTSKIFMSFLSLMLFPHFPHSVFSSPVSSFNIFIYIHTYS